MIVTACRMLLFQYFILPVPDAKISMVRPSFNVFQDEDSGKTSKKSQKDNKSKEKKAQKSKTDTEKKDDDEMASDELDESVKPSIILHHSLNNKVESDNEEDLDEDDQTKVSQYLTLRSSQFT